MTHFDKDAANSALDTFITNFAAAYAAHNIEDCFDSLDDHFLVMRLADKQKLFSADELTEHVHAWSRGVLEVSNLSHISAFTIACAAWKKCQMGEEGHACSELLVNTAGVHINLFAHSAMLKAMSMTDSISPRVTRQDGRPFDEAGRYISAVAHVMMATSKYFSSQPLQDTFYDALTQFERMLSSLYFTPSERYRYVRKIADYAEAQFPRAGALLTGMNDLLDEAIELPSGQKIIQLDLERQADEIAADTKAHAPQKPVDIKTALALRAGVPAGYAGLYQGIEKALAQKDARQAEDRIYRLFEKLALDEECDADTTQGGNAPGYLMKASVHLLSLSAKNAFNLASRCITTIDRQVGVSEELQTAVYGFALPMMADWELSAPHRPADTKEMNKVIMRHTSEFDDEVAAEDMFNSASIGYEAYLMSVHPTVRYDEIKALSDWVKERSVPSPMLVDFVEEWLEQSEPYDEGQGIPMADDRAVPELALVPTRAP